MLKRFKTNCFLLKLEWRGYRLFFAGIEEWADQNTAINDVEIESRSVLNIKIISY